MYTVVIADDEKSIRKSLIQKVDWEAIGFKFVGEAENGVDALELVEKLEPDLLLTDIKMPFLTGIELARQVREIRPATQIAFLTGYDDFAFAQQAIQYNIISYILKPITLEKITKELVFIREKMEKKYQEFLSTEIVPEKGEKTNFLLTLLLDSYSSGILENMSGDYEQLVLQKALDCGILKTDSPETMNYVVMTTVITDKDGKKCTVASNINAVDAILQKYFKYSSIFAQWKIVSLLIGTKKELRKYIPIAAEEIVQSVSRFMGCDALVGISRISMKIMDVHECYIESMKAISQSQSNLPGIYFITDLEQGMRNGEFICERVLEIINENYMNCELSLGEVSDQIGISPNYLSSLIKKEKGISFKELLTQKRMKVARYLLSCTSMKIWEICEKCGYSEAHYFSYCFKKYTGESPNAFRKKHEE